MAIRYNTSLFCTNNTDADFRAWVQFIEDTLVTTGGWVVTGDTGQMTIASATKPGAANTKVGYRVYRMNDSLQATAPCFVKLYFGSGGATLSPGVWVVVGTGSDGSGGITGTVYDDSAVSSPTWAAGTNSTSTAQKCFGSASTGRVGIALWINTVSSAYGQAWGLERIRDSNGAETTTGWVMIWMVSGTGLTRSKWLEPALGGTASQPATELGVAHILSGNNPSTFGDDVLVGLIFPIKASAQPPATNFIVVKQYHQLAQSQIEVGFEGSTKRYVSLDPLGASHPGGSTLANSIAYLRWE